MSYVGATNSAETRVRLNSYSLGDSVCDGLVWVVVGLSDKPGLFIVASIDEHTTAELEGFAPLFRPSLKITHAGLIATTAHVVAYLVCGVDIRGPNGQGPGDSIGIYGSEDELVKAGIILAKDAFAVTWRWR